MRNSRIDRFGNMTMLIGCKENKNGYPVGYLEIGNTLYKVEPSPANKDGVLYWVKLTKLNKRNNSSRF